MTIFTFARFFSINKLLNDLVLSSSHGVLAREVSDIDNSAGEQSTGSSQHPTHLGIIDI